VGLLAVVLQQQADGDDHHKSGDYDDQDQVLAWLGWRFLSKFKKCERDEINFK